MEQKIKALAAGLAMALAIGCHRADDGSAAGADGGSADQAGVVEGTPVTITHPEVGVMAQTVDLEAQSAFLLKSYVKASANGYLEEVDAQLGAYVSRGTKLFVLQTKESRSLGNTVTDLDTSLHFEGIITIKAPGEGYITQLNYRPGDYVQDGEQLAVISDARSFVFLLNLPYELRPYLEANRRLQLHLPDGTVLEGVVSEALPSVDPASQTQQYVIRVTTPRPIPENLIARVSLVKQEKQGAVSLPRAAVLSDEVQSRFWVMRMIDSTTAVRVPIQKGMETQDRVEVLSPVLKAGDSILLTGNYGLPDTAKVSVQNTEP